jgi:putative membrane protein
MALFWVGVILLVAWAVRSPRQDTYSSEGRALAILEERFARGELDADEFTTRRQQLAR